MPDGAQEVLELALVLCQANEALRKFENGGEGVTGVTELNMYFKKGKEAVQQLQGKTLKTAAEAGGRGLQSVMLERRKVGCE